MKAREEGIAIRQSCRAGQPQLFDQPILQGPDRTLDPTLRRARIGADDVDVERMQRPAKLGHAVTGECAWMVDPEDAMLVAIEGDRFAPGLQIGARRTEIGESRLALERSRAASAVDGSAFAAACDQAIARLRSSTSAKSRWRTKKP